MYWFFFVMYKSLSVYISYNVNKRIYFTKNLIDDVEKRYGSLNKVYPLICPFYISNSYSCKHHGTRYVIIHYLIFQIKSRKYRIYFTKNIIDNGEKSYGSTNKVYLLWYFLFLSQKAAPEKICICEVFHIQTNPRSDNQQLYVLYRALLG